jgi:hypothetical protein
MVPAAAVLVCTLSGILMMGARDMRSWAATRPPVSAREALSPFSTAEDSPRTAADIFMDEQLMGLSGQDIFIETTVAQDGRVSGAWLLEGETAAAAPILKELRLQRGVPGRDLAGRPVRMRAFRLITAVEVRAPLT